MKVLMRVLMIAMLVTTLGLVGCGDDGDDGDRGPAGPAGPAGPEGPEGPAGAVTLTDESCNICHGDFASYDYNELHPEPLEKPVVKNIIVERDTSDNLIVTFDLFEADGTTRFTDLASDPSDVRVYFAAIVPAGTVTANAPKTTWDTDFPEMWAEVRGSDSGVSVDEISSGRYQVEIPATVGFNLIGGADALEATAAQKQRLYVRADARDFDGFNRTMAVADFDMPVQGAETAALQDGDTTRTIVVKEACTACHNDPLQEAAHGGGYQSPQVCVMCHSPIGERGDEMQDTGAWQANLFHKIHAGIDMAAYPDRFDIDRDGDGEIDATEEFGYSAMTYPKNIKDCEVCHFDAGQDMADAWKTNPTAEACGTCHDVTFGLNATHTGGTQPNASCAICHPASGNGFGQSVAGAHEIADPATYFSTVSLEADANGDGVYEAGETPLITVTVEDKDGNAISPLDENITRANLYVYGPRSAPVPVLTPGSTTDPGFDPADGAPSQGVSMLANADDPQVETDEDGFKYRLLAIPEEGLEAGTYMIQAYVTDLTRTPEENRYRTSVSQFGWTFDTFQIGTATETPAISGDCFTCHQENDWGTMYHRSYFGADGCVACHDLSGNHANYLGNRVHAVHDASQNGDLLGAAWDGSDTENPDHYVLFPQDITSCDACHNSGNMQYREDPNMYAPNCLGCHGDTDGVRDHLIQNGGAGLGAH